MALLSSCTPTEPPVRNDYVVTYTLCGEYKTEVRLDCTNSLEPELWRYHSDELVID